jgi:arabinose-5-phosphate isomerase
VQDALMVMTEGRLGLGIVGSSDLMVAIITPFYMRSLVIKGAHISHITVADVASPQPLTARPDERMADAEARMLESRVQCLVVVDDAGAVVGVIQIYEQG